MTWRVPQVHSSNVGLGVAWGRREDGLRVNLQPGYLATTVDALRQRSDSLGFEAEMNGDGNVRGNGLAAPRCRFVLVLLQGFHRGPAQ